jgi:hypothetical protein
MIAPVSLLSRRDISVFDTQSLTLSVRIVVIIRSTVARHLPLMLGGRPELPLKGGEGGRRKGSDQGYGNKKFVHNGSPELLVLGRAIQQDRTSVTDLSRGRSQRLGRYCQW